LDGVIRLRLLNAEEKKEILKTETQEEEKIIWGMCKSINEGVREALNRDYTIAIVIDSSKFKYPYHPHMEIRYRDRIVGEEVSKEKAAELRIEKTNMFLWETFVIYPHKTPKGSEAREEMRLHYISRPFETLKGLTEISDCVLGVTSSLGDEKIKEFLESEPGGPEIGTCLIGYNLSTDH